MEMKNNKKSGSVAFAAMLGKPKGKKKPCVVFGILDLGIGKIDFEKEFFQRPYPRSSFLFPNCVFGVQNVFIKSIFDLHFFNLCYTHREDMFKKDSLC